MSKIRLRVLRISRRDGGFTIALIPNNTTGILIMKITVIIVGPRYNGINGQANAIAIPAISRLVWNLFKGRLT